MRLFFFSLFPLWIVLLLFIFLPAAWSAEEPRVSSLLPSADTNLLTIEYPYNNTLFPIDITAPTFRWRDENSISKWRLEIEFNDGQSPLKIVCDQNRWCPENKLWTNIKRRSLENTAVLTVFSLDFNGRAIKNRQTAIHFTTSNDPVSAPIFYRDVPLPFRLAFMKIDQIKWKLGHLSSEKPPKTVLANLRACANCHSFSADGSLLAMDVDYGNDKGSYIISPIEEEVNLQPEELISWNDYRPDDGDKSFGFLSQISPDGRYIVSTVKDKSVQLPVKGIDYSLLFFPIQGTLVVFDRKTKELYSLSGADNPDLIQTNPAWSPDGKWIVFARAQADEYVDIQKKYIENKKKVRYDLYRIPFNEGRGGTAKPLAGASCNRKSNFFPKYSPDGKWIVFCQAESYMLLQADSLLYIVPADGGQPKLMRCNHPGNMNSWHSFSPNSRWLVFSSKVDSPYTRLWLTHIDQRGTDSPPVLLENFIAEKRAANIPEFVNIKEGELQAIHQHIFERKKDR